MIDSPDCQALALAEELTDEDRAHLGVCSACQERFVLNQQLRARLSTLSAPEDVPALVVSPAIQDSPRLSPWRRRLVVWGIVYLAVGLVTYLIMHYTAVR